ncbi:MAG: hypothetical protein FJ087_07035 [Deltaproteobacteria bacterium]|nr:hypothetical protein [Deltaproteobacteria bacterium]
MLGTTCRRALDAARSVVVAARRRLPAGRAAEWGAPLLVLAVGVFLYAPLAAGDMPLNHDHPVLALRAWMMGQAIADHGTPYAYSPTLFAGIPADGLYPIGTDLLVGLVRVVTFGLAGWETAYCWALLAAILAYPGALYALGRRIAGPLAGAVAGVLALLDHGDYMQSGWDFTINWGVWAMGLAFTFCLWTVWALDRVVERPSRGRVVALGALAAGALLAHPMALPILGVVVPVQLAWTAAARGLAGTRTWLPSAALGLGLGGALAAFWYLPFMSHGDWYEPLGQDWQAFGVVVSALLDGTILKSFAPAFVFLGGIGLAWAAMRRQALAATFLLATGLLLYVSSNTFLQTFDVLAKLPGVANIQMERFSYYIRAALLLGTGVCVAMLFREGRAAARAAAGEVAPRAPVPVRAGAGGGGIDAAAEGRARLAVAAGTLRLAMAAVVIAPFLLHKPATVPPYFVPKNRLDYASDGTRLDALREAAEALGRLAPAQVGRVAVEATRHEHLLMMLPIYTGLPIFKVGFTPENNYRFKPEDADPEFRRALGISHVLSVGPSPHRAGLAETGRFGDLRLYEVTGWRPERVRLSGGGAAEVLRDEPGAVDVRLSGTAAGDELTVLVGRFASWNARIDGEPIAIDGAHAGDSPPLFTKVAARDGLLELRWEAGRPEWLGALTTVAALIAAAFLLVLARSARARAAWEARTGRVRGVAARAVTWGAAGLAALAVVGAVVVLAMPGRARVAGREVVADLADRLPDGSVEVVRPHGPVRCAPWQDGRFQCPAAEWNWVGPTTVTAGGLVRQCTWMHPAPDGRLVLHLPAFPLGERLEGHLGLSDLVAANPGRAAVRMTVAADGAAPCEFTAPPALGWNEWTCDTTGLAGAAADVTVTVEAADTAQRHFCMTLRSTRAP